LNAKWGSTLRPVIDRTGLATTHPEKRRQFYEQALAPLGYSVRMEVPREHTGGLVVLGYGVRPSPTS